ncbi:MULTISPECIES: phosphatase [unclassified Fusobacterium]|uniref:phosphatase n=1 Tax=unclassified Fusobacterium TaxID=2648384 RepID=UPI0032C431F7|nr:putative phosphatase YcdX [Fusobacterium sp. DD45]MBR8752038.1 putative phosphatase YcdX [Fusobacterium sp. DD26]
MVYLRYPIDLHIHTNNNPHAYSTLEENIRSAQAKNMEVIAITNHGPALQDSPHWWSLMNMRVLPEYVGNLRVLKGVETNVVDENGNFDINQRIYDVMDIILCGLHTIEAYGSPKDIIKNTKALVNMITSQKVDIIVHMGNPTFPVEYERVVMAAAENGVAIEINNSSLRAARKGSKPNCKKILELCLKYNCNVSLGTDSHISYDIGEFAQADALIEEVGYRREKIINYSKENLEKFLEMRKERKRKIL